MDCTEYLEGFSEYLDGVLEPEMERVFESHRDSCPECARYTEVVLEGQVLLRAFSSIHPGEDFEARLENRLHSARNEAAIAKTMGTGGSTTAVLSIAAILLVVAWSPLLFVRSVQVELAPITVSRPAPRPLGLRLPTATVRPASNSPAALDLDRDLWQEANQLLLEYSPVLQRYRTSSARRLGIDDQ